MCRFEILIFFKLKNVYLYILEEADVLEEAPRVSGPSTDTYFASTPYGSKRKKKNGKKNNANTMKINYKCI